ncbi:MAG: PF20097 family protein [Clostridia bacterium]|nr:PF20097 family protein [Clostridia bacterium]
MICPYCGKEMTKGYIQSRDGVYWTAKKQLVPALSFFGKDALCLANTGDGKTTVAEAHKCADCGKIVIDLAGRPE